MTKPIINDQGDIREMNNEEFAQYKIDQAHHAAQEEAEAQKEIAKAALLEKLGITKEEAQLLLS